MAKPYSFEHRRVGARFTVDKSSYRSNEVATYRTGRDLLAEFVSPEFPSVRMKLSIFTVRVRNLKSKLCRWKCYILNFLLNEKKIQVNLRRSVPLTASAFKPSIGQYVSSPGHSGYCYAGLTVLPRRAASGWVDLCAWFCAEVVYPSKDGHPPRHRPA